MLDEDANGNKIYTVARREMRTRTLEINVQCRVVELSMPARGDSGILDMESELASL